MTSNTLAVCRGHKPATGDQEPLTGQNPPSFPDLTRRLLRIPQVRPGVTRAGMSGLMWVPMSLRRTHLGRGVARRRAGGSFG